MANPWRSETIVGGQAVRRGKGDTRDHLVGFGPLRVSASQRDIAVRAGGNVDLIVIFNSAQMLDFA